MTVLEGTGSNPALDVAVLEDDAVDAELLCRKLRQAWSAEVKVSVFSEVSQLERALSEASPDVVFCDLGLPDAQGIEVVERVVNSAGQAPVVVLTANDDPTIPVRALRTGAQDYLMKDNLVAESLGRALRYALARSFADGQVRRIAAELREANGELDQYAGIVAHDLRAPIRTARLFTDRLKACIITGSDPIQVTSCLESSLERIESLVDRLLRLASLRNESLDLEPMQLSAVVEAIGVYMLADLEAADATLTVRRDGSISADPILLQELLLNLIHNSLKYADPSRRPEIEFSIVDLGEEIEVTVADNGIGIEPEYRDRVFELFERMDSGRSDGLGFGLAFCRRVADLHRGRIEIIDPPSGIGTAFRIWVPRPA